MADTGKWITVKGHHIYIKDKDEQEQEILPDKPVENGDQWIADRLGVDIEHAADIHDAFLRWSDYGSSEIHNEDTIPVHPAIPSGAENAKLIDEYLNHPSIPKYKGNLYRGMIVRTDKLDDIDKNLKDGVWKEPGITAFSTSQEQANLYALPDTMSSSIKIKLEGNKHASTIGHISAGGGENEVLYPSSIKNGLKVKEYKKTPIYIERLDRKHFRETGEKKMKKVLLRYEYDIVLEDTRE